MINLQPHKEDFRYRSGQVGEIVTIEVEYDLGGHFQRGIYVSGRFSTIGDGFETFVIGGGRKGFRMLALPLARKSAKNVASIAQMIDAHAPAIAEALDKQGPQAARELIEGILAKVPQLSKA